MQTYEVEMKSLLGSPERAAELKAAMHKIDPSCELHSTNKQLNHYFEGGTLQQLLEKAAPILSGVGEIKLEDLATRAKEFSVRTRDKDGIVYLVVKASVGQDSSENGVARIEFEEKVDISIAMLDEIVLSAGFRYQAKWSREREEYACGGMNIAIDKNAGYGYLAEFEKIVDDPGKVETARAEVKAFMEELGAEELPQDRLERMFAHYNAHWQEYYGTDKTFTIE